MIFRVRVRRKVLTCSIVRERQWCIRDRAYGEPDLGVGLTSAILAACLPASAISLLVAIRINSPA